MPLAHVCSEVRAALHAWLVIITNVLLVVCRQSCLRLRRDKHVCPAEGDLALVLVRRGVRGHRTHAIVLRQTQCLGACGLLPQTTAPKRKTACTARLKRCAQADSLDTALEIVNANAHGNGTAIFTRSGAAARKFQDEVQVWRVGSTADRTSLILR